MVAKVVSGKGQHYDLCILTHNIDIEAGVCSVALKNDGSADRDRACEYCYSKYLFKKSPDAYQIKEVKDSEISKSVTKYGMKILRIGKNFECGHKKTRQQLYKLLEYCIKHKVQPIVTSKVLEYDKNVSQLVKQAAGVVHISLGDDTLESGAISQGATNRWRLAQALRYQQSGCTTQVRIVADITLPMSKLHKKAYDLGGGSKFILLTPLHYTSKAVFEATRSDITWEQAKSSGLFSYTHGDLRPNKIHDDWAKTKERCGTVAGKEFCNNCGLGKINFSKKAYKEELIKLGWE